MDVFLKPKPRLGTKSTWIVSEKKQRLSLSIMLNIRVTPKTKSSIKFCQN